VAWQKRLQPGLLPRTPAIGTLWLTWVATRALSGHPPECSRRRNGKKQTSTRSGNTPIDPAIHRVRLDKLRIFEITEAKLEALERGSPESIFLNLGIAVLSTAISISVALTTTRTDSDRTFYAFVIVTSVGYVAGITFGLLWFISRRSLKNVSAKIRSRIPPEGVQENGDDTSDK